MPTPVALSSQAIDPRPTDGVAVGPELAAEAVCRYSDRLAALVRSRLGWRLRRKLDPEDVVQSVFRSFVRLQQRRPLDFENWDAIWALLALMTVRKCGHTIEHFTAACRSVAAEQSAGPGTTVNDPDSARCIEAFSREPDPHEAALLAETLQALLADLDDRDGRIVSLALEGATTLEISDEVERSERTVQRVLKRVCDRLAAQTT